MSQSSQSPEERAIRDRIALAETDRAEASAQIDRFIQGTKLNAGLAWGLMEPDLGAMKAREADAISRRTAAIAELAEFERR